MESVSNLLQFRLLQTSIMLLQPLAASRLETIRRHQGVWKLSDYRHDQGSELLLLPA